MPPHSRQPLRPSLVVAAVAAFAATGAVNAGCSSNSNQYVNCVDDNGRVVDPYRCDSSSSGGYYGGYHYYPSKKKYRVGTSAPSGWRSKSINPSDTAARSRAGLPSTGSIGGTSVRSGGFGSSGRGSSGRGSGS